MSDLTHKRDYRIGGVVNYYDLSHGESLMLVPDQVRKCVAFLMYDNGEKKLAGTVFFVTIQIPLSNGSLEFSYAVTARHVIEQIKARAIDYKAWIRVNHCDGSVALVPTDLDDWVYHPTDDSADVAVTPFMLPVDEVEWRSFPSVAFATDEIIKEWAIGIGDEIFLTGLFVHHAGKKKNIPIVRVGNIAAMPEELVHTEWNGGTDVEAYLIESRSIGGLSGSPVFVHYGYGVGRTERGGRPFYLLGLMQGHWDGSISDLDEAVADDSKAQSVNLGIGIVVPAKKIFEALYHPKLEVKRQKLIKIEQNRSAAKMDTLP